MLEVLGEKEKERGRDRIGRRKSELAYGAYTIDEKDVTSREAIRAQKHELSPIVQTHTGTVAKTKAYILIESFDVLSEALLLPVLHL